jgi:O-methyltransferase involved in polyketide biosynthesis
MAEREGDLTVTALYTSAAWAWAGFRGAELFLTREAGAVFSVTNFVMALSRLLRPDTPSLRWSLAQRHAVIDHLAERSGASQIVELAAGLSRRGAAFSERPGVRYVEVDLPAMIAKKESLLARTVAGAAVRARSSLVRVAADVRELDFGSVVEPGAVCVIAEGLLMYLDADAQRTLWRRVAALFADHPGSTFLFDLVPATEQPQPGLLGQILGWLMARFTEGRGFVRDERTRAHVVAELEDLGFADVRALEPSDLADEMAVPGEGQHTQVVVFCCRGVASE